MRILLAEDGPVDTLLLRNILSHAGYDVLPVRDGEAALEALNENDDIGLVVTDVAMPRMDGPTLLRKIRESEEHKDLPVVFVTASAEAAVVREGLELGLKGYILKPLLEPSRVVETVARALRQTGRHYQG